MAGGSHTQFKGVANIGDTGIGNTLLSNLITFLDWGFVNIGGFYNINIPTVGAYGGNKHVLRAVQDPRYTDGQVWEGFRQNWVWESGTSAGTPIAISGIFVDNTFVSTTQSGASGYYINYPEGRVVFDTAISTDSSVTAEFSTKWIKVAPADEVPWILNAQNAPDRVDHAHFGQSVSGDWGGLAQTRMQLPMIAVEVTPKTSFRGHQLGGGQYVDKDILFYIISNDAQTARDLADIVSQQNEKTIVLYNTDLMADNNAYPLDYNGTPVSGALTYPDLVVPSADGKYGYNTCRLYDSKTEQGQRLGLDLFTTTVRMTSEVVLGNI